MEELLQRIERLEGKIEELSGFSTRTLDQDNAIMYRGFPKATGTTGTYPHTTYGGVGTYDVPSQPSGTLTVLINGKEYKIPFQ